MASDELPSYPQVIMRMILEAIDELKHPEGTNKSSISDYIESNYGEMPADHSDLLTTHLTKMKVNGELLMVNNNYLKPGSVNPPPPKRGRGRPPKPKDPLAPAMPGPPRPRGRPPSRNLNEPPTAKKPKHAEGSSGRPRGRPRKVKPQQAVENVVEA
ncbi:hypothetical protein OROGR_023859 [Orobanche gracilis]